MGKVSCTSDYPPFLGGPCPTPYNSTGNYYSTFSENEEHSHLLVSPVLVASAVVGVVLILSCITIIVGSLRRERQARLQWYHQQRNRHRRRHRRHHGDEEYDFMSDGHILGRRMRSMCGTLEEWPRTLELNSWGDVNPAVLRELYPDAPPSYEECVGPGATQLYIPTDAPPPYSLTDAFPPNGNPNPGAVESGIPNPVVLQPGILNPGTLEPGVLSPGAPEPGVLGAGTLEPGGGPGRPRDEQVHSISMDALPPYEILISSPRSSLLPLPGPGPMSPPDSPSLAPGGVPE
ncbi:protein BEAN1 isoform X1 [Sorex araneus]|uniref:protein BEAN1 isoform X1 n=1 Tax=Sorex araneus TaxID=42254 RepID=UPI0024338B50|nr:protein BEAN1 isoform X1 [Sorex araneus]XP_055002515.1 protein BEAN1 isoform X1 [Sorex araneus]XP_055002516.1 protein BEAN1 isoform X1 [Sorex araneus]